MGCSPSRVDGSVVVVRCKERRRVMKLVVGCRHDFAIAHMAYIQSLKSIGAALRRFAGAEEPPYEEDLSSPASLPSVPIVPWQLPPLPSLPPPVSTAPASPPPTLVAPALDSHSPPSTPPPPLTPPADSTPPSSLPPPAASSSSSSSPHPALPLSPPPVRNSACHPSASSEPSQMMSMSPLHPENMLFSLDQSPTPLPLYSPTKVQQNSYFMSISAPALVDPPPPPSPPHNYAWDYFNFFNMAPIPFHLLEQRKLGQEEELQDLQQVREDEGIPELEDEEHEVSAAEGKEADEEDKKGLQVQEKPEEKFFHDNIKEEQKKAVSDIATEMKSEGVEEITEEEEVAQNVEKKAVPDDTKNGDKKQIGKELIALIATSGKSLADVVRLIDDQFIRAYSSGKDVAEMLETTKAHNHLSFFDFKDSMKIFNAITSHWSKKTPLASEDSDADSDVAECGMMGSHASTLERLLAWEKKLYDEVKAGELIRIAFDRKCQQLQSQDAKGEDSIVIDKTRAAIKKLDTRLMVALCAVQSVSISIQKLMDEELYPQLIEILGGLVNMWKVMLECHKIQKEISLELKNLENSAAGEETSEAHRRATIELEAQLNKWQKCFCQWINSQSSYIKVLYSWLTFCQLGPKPGDKVRKVASYKAEEPQVLLLVRNWHSALDHIRAHQEVVDTVNKFSVVMHALQLQQSEELRQKRRAESFLKDLEQRIHLLHRMEEKYIERSLDSDSVGARSTVRYTLQGKMVALDDLKSRVDEEKEKHKNILQDRRNATLSSLQKNLPSIFEALSTFATIALDEYESLQQPQIQ